MRFAQISDSHIGFNGPANTNVTDTFNHAIGQVNGLGYTPENRKEVGLVQVLSSHSNLCLASIDRIARQLPFQRKSIF